MFTGIVETTGRVVDVSKAPNLVTISIESSRLSRGTVIGDSVAINGVCLTVCRKKGKILFFEMMKETLEATTLGGCHAGDQVNMERALQMKGRVGGHYVTGHVDGMVALKKIVTDQNYTEFRFSVPSGLRPYMTMKGSVCLDGVSLTVGKVWRSEFSVYLIPFTLKVTTLGLRKIGETVNMEVDILARYVHEQMKCFR
jgi:riboflavin synthase